MSNIYEALQHAQAEKKPDLASILEPAPGKIPNVSTSTGHSSRKPPLAGAEMQNLYRNIDCLLPDVHERIIQFVSASEGQGVSTIVRQFAQTAACKFGRRVLIMDAAHHNPTQHIHFMTKSDVSGWKNTVGQEASLDGSFFQADTNLFLLPISAQATLIPQIHNRAGISTAFKKLKTIFDLVIIDSSPAATSPDSLALTGCCDGVILVVEAERTRWQMAESVKEKITRNGGNILGIVFNKRRFHIPECIYKRL